MVILRKLFDGSSLTALARRQAGAAGCGTAPFHQNHIVPDVVEVPVAFTCADLAETAMCMQGTAGLVGCQDLRLQGPIAVRLGGFDKRAYECPANAAALCFARNVYADLSDPGGASRVGNRP